VTKLRFDGYVGHRPTEGDPCAAAIVDNGGTGELVRVGLVKFDHPGWSATFQVTF